VQPVEGNVRTEEPEIVRVGLDRDGPCEAVTCERRDRRRPDVSAYLNERGVLRGASCPAEDVHRALQDAGVLRLAPDEELLVGASRNEEDAVRVLRSNVRGQRPGERPELPFPSPLRITASLQPQTPRSPSAFAWRGSRHPSAPAPPLRGSSRREPSNTLVRTEFDDRRESLERVTPCKGSPSSIWRTWGGLGGVLAVGEAKSSATRLVPWRRLPGTAAAPALSRNQDPC
jgi:hypothetical protein